MLGTGKVLCLYNSFNICILINWEAAIFVNTVTVLIFQTPVKPGRRERLRGFLRLWPWTQMRGPPPFKWSPTQAHRYNRWRRAELTVPQRWLMLCPQCTKESGTLIFCSIHLQGATKKQTLGQYGKHMCSVTNASTFYCSKQLK